MKIFVIQKGDNETIVESEKKVEEEKDESKEDGNLEMSPHGCMCYYFWMVSMFLYLHLTN